MFEQFPYTDMHQLNLDWIIKIAKDFLDQYTSLQQMISDGEQSLTDLTQDGLNDLQEKADTLQGLLDAWYTEHSNDIANQLTDALQDIADTLSSSITAFNTAAAQKAAETIATIPADYSQTVANITRAQGCISTVKPCFVFDTVNSTLTLKYPIYVILNNTRVDLEGDDVVLNYGSVNANIQALVIRNNAPVLIAQSEINNQTDIYLFTFNKTQLVRNRTLDIKYPYSINGIEYNTEHRKGELLSNSPMFVFFDTVNNTITFKANFYILFNNYRWDFESGDVTVNYVTTGSKEKYVVLRFGEIIAINYTEFNTATDIELFEFNYERLERIGECGLDIAYNVNGKTYNRSGLTIYVDKDSENPVENGSLLAPYKAIYKAVSCDPEFLIIAPGTYNEGLNILDKENVTVQKWTLTQDYSATSSYIIVNYVKIQNSRNVHIANVLSSVPGSAPTLPAWDINNCDNLEVINCIAENANPNGFQIINTNGTFFGCIAHSIGSNDYPNADGFNIHGHGITKFVYCIAYDCIDDGISHHDKTIGYIDGCECYNCATGIAPENSRITVNASYIHNNTRGYYSNEACDYAILENSTFLTNNLDIDVRVGTFKNFKNHYTNKNITSNVNYAEV